MTIIIMIVLLHAIPVFYIVLIEYPHDILECLYCIKVFYDLYTIVGDNLIPAHVLCL